MLYRALTNAAITCALCVAAMSTASADIVARCGASKGFAYYPEVGLVDVIHTDSVRGYIRRSERYKDHAMDRC